MSALFTTGGTLHIQKAGLMIDTHAGIDAWVENMRTGWSGQPTLHAESNIVISEPEPGLIVSHSTWSAFVGGALASYGTHADVLRKEGGSDDRNGEWKFQRRVVRHLYPTS